LWKKNGSEIGTNNYVEVSAGGSFDPYTLEVFIADADAHQGYASLNVEVQLGSGC
jgi:hypothetical protein